MFLLMLGIGLHGLYAAAGGVVVVGWLGWRWYDFSRTRREYRQLAAERDEALEKLANRDMLAALQTEIGKILTQNHSLARVLQGCSEALLRVTDAGFVRIWTFNSIEQVLELQASAGLYTRLDGRHSRVALGKQKIGIIAQNRTPLLTNNIFGDPQITDQEWARQNGFISFAGYPLICGDRLHGVMALFARHSLREFTLKQLEAISDQIALDIERRQSEEALLTTERRLRDIIEYSTNLFYLHTTDHVLQYVSPQSRDYFDCTPEEARVRWMEFITDNPCNEVGYERTQKAIDTGEIQPPYELELITKKGRIVWVEVREAPVVHDGKTVAIVGSLTDITARKLAEARRDQLEAQLFQAKKMEAVGQLAGGVAHDFNNLLTVILGNVHMIIEDELVPSEEGRVLATEISKAAERATGLTRQLLAFSRRQVMQVKWIDLGRLMEDMTDLLRRLVGREIDLSVEVAPHLPLIRADSAMVEQVIMNLVLNARDAMREGGRLQIDAHLEKVGPEHVGRNPHAQLGQAVVLVISDTGTGMQPETMTRIFEPFFTTKPPGSGTGLGLATVYGIVSQHEGWIEVDTNPGRGSTFKVYFAANAPAPTGANRQRKEPVSQPTTGGETILVVEDEEAVRRLVGTLLQRCGYRVLEAADGRHALKVWREHPGKIDLLLTDMVMPGGITGKKLAEDLRAAHPGLKVIFASGYSREIKLAESIEDPQIAFLSKPFNRDALTRTVRQLLETSPFGAE